MKLSKAPPACPGCGSPAFIRNGSSRNGSGRLLCRRCGRTFSPRAPFPGARHPPAIILEALVLSGRLPQGKVLAHLASVHGAEISRQTLSAWKRRHLPTWADYCGAFLARQVPLSEICRQVAQDFPEKKGN